MSKITDKFNQLKSHGLDLGADLDPGKPDTDAGYGGTFRRFQNGNIYYHPVMGDSAHEVHGGILSLYLARGGPGIDPVTKQRLFGFPMTDELTAGIDQTPVSKFETGGIFWTRGTGGVVLSGPAYTQLVQQNAVDYIGPPITPVTPIAGGEAIFCDRGVVWTTSAVPNASLLAHLSLPLMGHPAFVNLNPPVEVSNTDKIKAAMDVVTLSPSLTNAQPIAVATAFPTGANAVAGTAPAAEAANRDTGIVNLNLVNINDGIGIRPHPSIPGVIKFNNVHADLYAALIHWRPTLISDIWAGRFSLINTAKRDNRIPLNCVPRVSSASNDTMSIVCDLELIATPGHPALERTLYDLEASIPTGALFYPLSPHAVYTRSTWTDFGVIHITDLHLSKRNQDLRAKLQALGRADSAANYANCQDQFRDFIRYANHLHDAGLADAIMATGDLIDYDVEAGDNPVSGNFERMRRMILGQPFDAGVAVGEELRLPIFMTFGNHDYRTNPYDLRCSLHLTTVPVLEWVTDELGADTTLDEHSTFDLTEDDAKALAGGNVPEYGASDFDKPLGFLKVNNNFTYFGKYFSLELSYSVPMGPHRLVMVDSKFDAGVPNSAGFTSLLNLAWEYARSDLPANTLELATGCPDSMGVSDYELNILKGALTEAGNSGIVLVGIHSPPIAPVAGYNDYLRETEHPTANPQLVTDYMSANNLHGSGWSKTGTGFFMTGSVVGNLDFGIGVGSADAFLQLCAGVGVGRPIDMLFCGHHHDRVEYRLHWDGTHNHLEYYMDFYTDNPGAYYSSNTFEGGKSHSFKILVNASAHPNPAPTTITWHASTNPLIPITITYPALIVPPYNDPLNSSSDPAGWWQRHRPLLVQTAALGPIDPRQRYNGMKLADPTFQGFRVMIIRNSVIKRVRYVTIRDMRTSNFVLPWEKEDSLVQVNTSVITGVLTNRADLLTHS